MTVGLASKIAVLYAAAVSLLLKTTADVLAKSRNRSRDPNERRAARPAGYAKKKSRPPLLNA